MVIGIVPSSFIIRVAHGARLFSDTTDCYHLSLNHLVVESYNVGFGDSVFKIKIHVKKIFKIDFSI